MAMQGQPVFALTYPLQVKHYTMGGVQLPIKNLLIDSTGTSQTKSKGITTMLSMYFLKLQQCQ